VEASINKIREENMPKAVVIYLSTSGNTRAMADAIVEGAKSRNIDAVAVNFHEARIEDIKAAYAVAIGSSTFYYKMLPPMEKFIEVFCSLLLDSSSSGPLYLP